MDSIGIKIDDVRFVLTSSIQRKNKLDQFCQTWIWFYIFIRIIIKCKIRQFIHTLEYGLNSEQTLKIIETFWKQLLKPEMDLKDISVPDFCVKDYEDIHDENMKLTLSKFKKEDFLKIFRKLYSKWVRLGFYKNETEAENYYKRRTKLELLQELKRLDIKLE